MASKRHQRRKGCEGKLQLSQVDAEARAARQSEWALSNGQVPLNAYHCAGCGFWHLGHKPMPTTDRSDYKWTQSGWIRGRT